MNRFFLRKLWKANVWKESGCLHLELRHFFNGIHFLGPYDFPKIIAVTLTQKTRGKTTVAWEVDCVQRTPLTTVLLLACRADEIYFTHAQYFSKFSFRAGIFFSLCTNTIMTNCCLWTESFCWFGRTCHKCNYWHHKYWIMWRYFASSSFSGINQKCKSIL